MRSSKVDLPRVRAVPDLDGKSWRRLDSLAPIRVSARSFDGWIDHAPIRSMREGTDRARDRAYRSGLEGSRTHS